MEAPNNAAALAGATLTGSIPLITTPLVTCSLDCRTATVAMHTTAPGRLAVCMNASLILTAVTAGGPTTSMRLVSPEVRGALGWKTAAPAAGVLAACDGAVGSHAGYWLHPALADGAIHCGAALAREPSPALVTAGAFGCYHPRASPQGVVESNAFPCHALAFSLVRSTTVWHMLSDLLSGF